MGFSDCNLEALGRLKEEFDDSCLYNEPGSGVL